MGGVAPMARCFPIFVLTVLFATVDTLLVKDGSPPKTKMGPGDNIYFMHIPKAAGTSFMVDVHRHIREDSTFHTSEGCFVFGEGMRVFTIFRDPRTHVLSMYYHCTTSYNHHYGASYMPKTFPQWVHAWQQHKLAWSRNGLHPFCCYRAGNLIAGRYLCGDGKNWTTEKEGAWELVQKRFNKTAFVGLAEAYQESLCLLHIKELKEFPSWCECKAWRGLMTEQHHSSHGSAPHSITNYSDKVLKEVDEITNLDRKLYNMAKKRFLNEVHAVEKQYNKKILCREINLEVDADIERDVTESPSMFAETCEKTSPGNKPSQLHGGIEICHKWMKDAKSFGLNVPHPKDDEEEKGDANTDKKKAIKNHLKGRKTNALM